VTALDSLNRSAHNILSGFVPAKSLTSFLPL
jgi:hypothetical protein